MRTNDVRIEAFLLFGNSMSDSIYYAFLYYQPHIGSDDIVEKSIMQLARLDSWAAIVLKY